MSAGPSGLHHIRKCTILNPAVTRKATHFDILDVPGAPEVTPKALFGMDREALATLLAEMGESAWRGRQLAEAIYVQRLTSINDITTLPLALRGRLTREGWDVCRPRIAQVFRSVDGTERYLVEGVGGPETVETVWMPEGDDGEAGDGSEAGAEESRKESASGGSERRRATICVSSQVGCAVNCQFCLTAKLGLQRNLTAGEIAGQVVAVLERQARGDRPRPRQPCLHGHGRAVPELRQLHGGGAAAGD